MPSNPDRACEHENFHTEVGVHRLTNCRMPTGGPIIGYTADISIACVDCGERFRWIGLPLGVSGQWPTVSIDGHTMHAPLRPAGSDPDFGMGIPGFDVRFSDPS